MQKVNGGFVSPSKISPNAAIFSNNSLNKQKALLNKTSGTFDSH